MSLDASRQPALILPGQQPVSDVLESISDAFFAVDHIWRFTYLNSAAERLLLRKRNELLGRNVWHEFPEAVGTHFEEESRRAVAENVTVEFDSFYEPLDAWLAIRAYPTPGGLSVYFQDITQKKRAEKELHDREQRLRALCEQSAAGIAQVDLSGRFLFVNQRYCQITGYSAEELASRRMQDITHPDDVRHNLDMMSQAALAAGEYEIEKRYCRKDGSVAWVSLSADVVRDTNGKVQSVLGVVIDITARKSMEETLRRSESRLQLAVDTAQIGLWDIDLATGAVDESDRLIEILGLPRGTRHKNAAEWGRYVHPEDLDHLQREYAAAMELSRDFEIESRIIHPDGAVRWVSGRGRVVRDRCGKPVRMLGVLSDITGRKHAELAARQAAETFNAVIRACPLAMVVVDADGLVKLWNPAAEALLGWKEEEVIGHFSPAVSPERRPEILEHIRGTLEGRLVRGRESRRFRKDGQIIAVSAWTAPLPAIEDQPRQIIAILDDLTEQKRAGDELRKAMEAAEAASAAKDRFLAMLSHELRTPLTPVMLALSAMERDKSLSAAMQEDLAMIRRNLDLEARLIDDMLDLSRVVNGKMRLQLQPANVHALVQNVLEIFKGELAGKGLCCHCELAATDDQVRADPARLQQVFWNLLSNAIKFTPESGRITIRSSNPASGTFAIEVTDTGIGIEPERLPRIFDAFDQGEHTVTRRYGGLGLGLAVSKAILDLHGFSIRAESAGREAGSRFVLEMKTTGVVELVNRIAPLPAGVSNKTVRLLLVDDHHDTLRSLKRLLEFSGYSVMTAGSVASALALASSHSFDLLISDIGLPDATGHDLMRQIKARYNLPGIAVSGFGMEHDLRQSEEAGFAEHLTKPLDLDLLKAAIVRTCAAHQSAPVKAT